MVQRTGEVNPTDAKEFVSFATFLPVRRWRHVVPFFRMALKIENQLRTSENVVRYALKTDFPHKRFWTYSVWTSRDAVNSFVKAEPHHTPVKKFAEWAGDGAAFVDWTDPEGKIDWEEAERRLVKPTFYYRK